jgi:hypothetical protein
MRRALGLQDESSPRPQPNHSAPAFNGSHRTPHRFVRDGEVPVVHLDQHPHGEPGGNQLEAARQTIRSLTAAREHAERSLEQAQTTIRDLRTKLAHERLARDESVARAGTEKQAAEQAQAELVVERAARQQAEGRLAEALECRPQAEVVPSRGGPGRKVGRARTASAPGPAIDAEPEGTGGNGMTAPTTQARRRGRPPKVSQPDDAEYVEWWKPGWKERLR